MRSVVIHLVGVTRDAVNARLSQFAQAQNGESWVFPPQSLQPSLYIQYYDDYEREVEEGQWLQLIFALGKKPDITVIANVSGRVSGEIEVGKFAECLLGEYRGIAQDEYSEHFWTLAEIQSGAVNGGRNFF